MLVVLLRKVSAPAVVRLRFPTVVPLSENMAIRTAPDGKAFNRR